MRIIAIALVITALGWAAPRSAAAQPLFGFGAFSMNRDINGGVYPGASGGVLFDVAGSWLSVGAQADLFASWPYFAGRGGPLAQVNLVRGRRVRLFVVGGIAWGEQAGPMIGAGIDVWTRGRVGVRASVQDYVARVQGLDCAFLGYDQVGCHTYLHDGRAWTAHQPSVQIGIIWR